MSSSSDNDVNLSASVAEVPSAPALQIGKYLHFSLRSEAKTCVLLLEGLQGGKILLYVKRNKAISLGNATTKVGIEV
ncbi:hypothetical protein Tco_1085707 [Tanacetum coccineum]